ncbi:MAG: Fused nickel transport protein NikMN [Chloroflexi bacterium ADurb.Bin325]|nr:MAG: Fused nickel transport protein NikMN [Chloroflexi bacterium ADurb.Bin325]
MFLSVQPMHIPDGFLSVAVSVLLWLLSVAAIAYALQRVNRELGERQVPLMGVLAACIFAGQMLNFSVTGGTSGHLMGAAIATILLGPWAAIIVMTAVVSVQALIFQDGGLLALGANLFNMGVIGVTVSYFAYHTLRRLTGDKPWSIIVSGFVAAWLSIFIASLAVALQLAVSGTSPANVAVAAMGGVHALIGIGEGLITAGALAFLLATRRDLVGAGAPRGESSRTVWLGGLAIAALLAVLAPLASAHPDGLEWVAEQSGFLDRAQGPLYNIIPDYLLPGVSNEALSTILAGIIGLLIVAGVTLAVGQSRRRRASEGETK